MCKKRTRKLTKSQVLSALWTLTLDKTEIRVLWSEEAERRWREKESQLLEAIAAEQDYQYFPIPTTHLTGETGRDTRFETCHSLQSRQSHIDVYAPNTRIPSETWNLKSCRWWLAKLVFTCPEDKLYGYPSHCEAMLRVERILRKEGFQTELIYSEIMAWTLEMDSYFDVYQSHCMCWPGDAAQFHCPDKGIRENGPGYDHGYTKGRVHTDQPRDKERVNKSRQFVMYRRWYKSESVYIGKAEDRLGPDYFRRKRITTVEQLLSRMEEIFRRSVTLRKMRWDKLAPILANMDERPDLHSTTPSFEAIGMLRKAFPDMKRQEILRKFTETIPFPTLYPSTIISTQTYNQEEENQETKDETREKQENEKGDNQEPRSGKKPSNEESSSEAEERASGTFQILSYTTVQAIYPTVPVLLSHNASQSRGPPLTAHCGVAQPHDITHLAQMLRKATKPKNLRLHQKTVP